MWKVVTSSNLNPSLKLFFSSLILANYLKFIVKILWKYCDKISKWLFLILFLPFIHTFPRSLLFYFIFFSWFFLHHTRIPLSPPTLLFLFLFLVHSGSLVCVVASRTLLPLCFFLCLLHTQKFLSLYLTQTNFLSYTHRSPAEKWRLAFYTDRRSTFFYFFWFD